MDHYTRNPVARLDGSLEPVDSTHYVRRELASIGDFTEWGIGEHFPAWVGSYAYRPHDGGSVGYIPIERFDDAFTLVDPGTDTHAAPPAVVVVSQNGTSWQISVDDSGTVIATPI